MNRILPEMLHCMQTSGNLTGNNGTDFTVLERQRARFKWQQQQEQQQQHQNEVHQTYFNDTHFNNFIQLPLTTSNLDQSFMNNDSMIRELVNRSMKIDPSYLENGWTDFGKYPVPRTGFNGEIGFGLSSSTGFGTNSVDEMTNFSISQKSNSSAVVDTILPMDVSTMVVEEKNIKIGSPEKMVSTVGKEISKKRKADKAHNPKVGVAEELRDKRIKIDTTEEVESKITHEQQNNNNNRENSADTSKDNNSSSKNSEVQKLDYIHVRARRGQATDSHSLAERVRREKISERMKYLQDLVPGCNKITGKAGMLDEIINYVQSLQRQVEFLSMKLATINPRLDINIESFFTKDMFPVNSTGTFPNHGMSPSEIVNCSSYLQYNPVFQELVSSCGLDMVINPPEPAAATLPRSINTPVLLPETFLDTSSFTQDQPAPAPAVMASSTWENDLQNLYSIEEFGQGRAHPSVFPHQSFTGIIQGNNLNNLKMEM